MFAKFYYIINSFKIIFKFIIKYIFLTLYNFINISLKTLTVAIWYIVYMEYYNINI
jgi:hypothetical protein